MAGGDVLGAQLASAADQAAELQPLVAHHARIGRAPDLVFLGEVTDDLCLELGRLVDQAKGNAQSMTDGASIRDRLRVAASVFGAGQQSCGQSFSVIPTTS